MSHPPEHRPGARRKPSADTEKDECRVLPAASAGCVGLEPRPSWSRAGLSAINELPSLLAGSQLCAHLLPLFLYASQLWCLAGGYPSVGHHGICLPTLWRHRLSSPGSSCWAILLPSITARPRPGSCWQEPFFHRAGLAALQGQFLGSSPPC